MGEGGEGGGGGGGEVHPCQPEWKRLHALPGQGQRFLGTLRTRKEVTFFNKNVGNEVLS